ncbi:MAG: glycosyltransferase family 4 protein [Gammaproteobacteria bacterium]|nr:glycosyltransferase family 4 protein [Gammaproteobacteria bacterium]
MMPSDRRCRILHIVANYPDGVFRQNTTDAVKNLLEETSESLDHYVVSISRTLNPLNEYVVRGNNTTSVSYFGLPAAIGQSFLLRRLARRIKRELDDIELGYDIIHGHKLTVEALVAYYLTIKSEKPYVCTVRGLTDDRIMRWRPDRRGLYAKVLKKALVVFLPAPWTERLIKEYLNPVDEEWHSNISYSVLPNIVNFTRVDNTEPRTYKPKFVTVFREGHGKRKGFRELLNGLVSGKAKNQIILLDVIGCSAESEEAQWVKELGLTDQVSFLGKLENTETVKRMAQYRGFLLPTRYDTFGMVYTEALLAGVPVLYSGDTGIDGYLDELDVGVRVDPFDQTSINNGILKFNQIADELRDRLKIYLEEGRFDFFHQASIVSKYCQAIESCLEKCE